MQPIPRRQFLRRSSLTALAAPMLGGLIVAVAEETVTAAQFTAIA